jgi:hypothetical protein
MLHARKPLADADGRRCLVNAEGQPIHGGLGHAHCAVLAAVGGGREGSEGGKGTRNVKMGLSAPGLAWRQVCSGVVLVGILSGGIKLRLT